MAAAGQHGRVLAGRYELESRLGSGGAGTVWSGHDRALDRPVAVKLLHADLAEDPQAGTRFRTEATAAAKLTHPNAVLVYDLGRDGDHDYLVMELVAGTSLADLLVDGAFPADAAATVGCQVARALGAAHAAGIVHRDVKPGNVLVTREGTAKLADFGIARALGEVTARLTRTGMVLGTARYLAPEQLRDDPVDARADVYALGLVLHELLTGRPPFGEGNAVEVAARRLTTSLPRVRDHAHQVPAGLEEVIDWATSVDPGRRPHDGAQLAAALEAFTSPDATSRIATRVARATPPASAPPAGMPPPVAGAAPPAATPTVGTTGSFGTREGGTRALPATDAGETLALSAAGQPAARAPAAGAAAASRAAKGDAAAGDGAAGDATDGPNEPRRPAPTDAPREPGAGPSSGTVARRVVLAVLAVAAVLLVAIGLNTATERDRSGEEDRGSAPTAADDGSGDEPLPVADTGDHDPEGDRSEHGADTPLAVDGDRSTSWRSETYASADLGGFDKAGVGIWVELDDPVPLDRVEVEVADAGGAVELWTSEDGPPDDDQLVDAWGVRRGGGSVPSEAFQFPSLADEPVRTVLLWFTELPDAGGGFRAEVRELRLYAR